MRQHPAQTPVEIVGAALGLGGPDEGAGDAPARLRSNGLASRLATTGADVRWGQTVLPRVNAASRLDAVNAFNARLARRVNRVMSEGRFPLVVGGDHAIAAGTWTGASRALRPHGAMGLLWIDAHMDAHTRQTTPSGNPHGMPLATLLGADGTPAVVRPEHVAIVGVRSHEPEEEAFLRERGVRIFMHDEVEARGLDAVMSDALDVVSDARAGFGVTLDIDAIDPAHAPATSTREAGGLDPDALARSLATLGAHDALAGFELVEYNPRLDHDGSTAALVERLLVELLRARVAVNVPERRAA